MGAVGNSPPPLVDRISRHLQGTSATSSRHHGLPKSNARRRRSRHLSIQSSVVFAEGSCHPCYCRSRTPHKVMRERWIQQSAKECCCIPGTGSKDKSHRPKRILEANCTFLLESMASLVGWCTSRVMRLIRRTTSCANNTPSSDGLVLSGRRRSAMCNLPDWANHSGGSASSSTRDQQHGRPTILSIDSASPCFDENSKARWTVELSKVEVLVPPTK